MSSRTNFIHSSGVILFLSLCTVCYANYTSEEFVEFVSTCFSDAVSKKFNNVSLPKDKVESNILNLYFDKNKDLAHEQGVPIDSNTTKFLDDTIPGCYQEYIKLKNYTQETTLLVLTMVCTCKNIKFERSLSNLECNPISDAVANSNATLVNKLFTEGGFDILDPENGKKFEEHSRICIPKLMPLILKPIL